MEKPVGYFKNKTTGDVYIVKYHASMINLLESNMPLWVFNYLLTQAAGDQAFRENLIPEEWLKPYGDSEPEKRQILSEFYEFGLIEWSSLPGPAEIEDRHFRNAWTVSNGLVVVDMPKARDIHLDNLKKLRNEKLVSLDVDYIKADEKSHEAFNDLIDIITELDPTKTADLSAIRKKLNSGKDPIKMRKQQLRDMPDNEDLTIIDTPNELKEFIPDYLKPE